jgi:membrane complex biogenesis BtpA family protein
MISEWMNSIFNTTKPVIAMAHIPALPGTPRYDEVGGIGKMLDCVLEDVEKLIRGGVDAIMFCNEDDRPYIFKAGIEQITAMTAIVTRSAPKNIPFGVDFLWDPMAAMAIGHATGASFIREVITGTYESDMGFWSPNAGELLRFQRNIGAQEIKIFFNVEPEFGSPIGSRPLALRAKSALVSSLADAILISGPMAGIRPDPSKFREVRESIPDTPILLNTGAKVDNLAEYFALTDGVIVGSSLKVDGYTWNKVDEQRVVDFMEKAKIVRIGDLENQISVIGYQGKEY